MTPKLMGLDWYGFFFILPSFLWLFQVSVVVVLLVSPMLWICKKSLAAKIVHIPIGLYFAWYCVRLPWSMDMEYGLLQWILALSFLGIILMIFGAIFFSASSSSSNPPQNRHCRRRYARRLFPVRSGFGKHAPRDKPPHRLIPDFQATRRKAVKLSLAKNLEN